MGRLVRRRTAEALLGLQYFDRLHQCGAPRGHDRRGKGDPECEDDCAGDDRRSRALDAEQQGLTQATQTERQGGADPHADYGNAADLAEYQPADIAWRGAERDADTDLTQSLRDTVGQHRIQTDRGEDDCEARERG